MPGIGTDLPSYCHLLFPSLLPSHRPRKLTCLDCRPDKTALLTPLIRVHSLYHTPQQFHPQISTLCLKSQKKKKSWKYFVLFSLLSDKEGGRRSPVSSSETPEPSQDSAPHHKHQGRRCLQLPRMVGTKPNHLGDAPHHVSLGQAQEEANYTTKWDPQEPQIKESKINSQASG